MKKFPHILAGPNQLDPVVLQEARDDKGWTIAELSRRSGVDASVISRIEKQIGKSGKRAKQHEDTIRNLISALSIDLPDRIDSSIAKLTQRLSGEWEGAHLSRKDSDESVDIIRSTWKIRSMNDVWLQLPEEGLTYKGSFALEAQGRLVFQTFTNEEITEHAMWRFPYPVARHLTELNGHWSGIDFWQNSVTGPALLSKVREGKKRLTDLEIHERLRKIPNHSVRLNAKENLSEVEWYPEWKESLIDQAFEDIRKGEEITLLSTYYPHDIWLYDRLKKLQTRITKWGIRGVKIRVLFLNPENKGLIEARTHLLNSRTAEEFKSKIKEQAKNIEAFGSRHLKVEVLYCDQWISSMSFSVGKRFLAVGYLFANESAENGPMAVIRSNGNSAWNCFASEFNALWKENQPERTRKVQKRPRRKNS